jgi:hypothetical protein
VSKPNKFAVLLTALLCFANVASAPAFAGEMTLLGAGSPQPGPLSYLPQAVHFDSGSALGVASGDITNGAPRSCHIIVSFWHRSSWYNYQSSGGLTGTTEFGTDWVTSGANVGIGSELTNGIDNVIDSSRGWGMTLGNAVPGTVHGNTSAADNPMTTINPTFRTNFVNWMSYYFDSSLWHHYLMSANTCGSYTGGFGSNVFCGVMYIDASYALGGSGGGSSSRTTCGGPSAITSGTATGFDGSTCGATSFCIDLANVNNTGFIINYSIGANYPEGDYADFLVWYNTKDVVKLCTGNAAPVPECKGANQPYIAASDLANFMGSGTPPTGSAAIPLNPSIAIATYGKPVVDWTCGTSSCTSSPAAFATNQGSGAATGFINYSAPLAAQTLPYGPGGQPAHTSGIKWICTDTNPFTGSSGAYSAFASNCQNGPPSGGATHLTAGDLYYVVYSAIFTTSQSPNPSCNSPSGWTSATVSTLANSYYGTGGQYQLVCAYAFVATGAETGNLSITNTSTVNVRNNVTADIIDYGPANGSSAPTASGSVANNGGTTSITMPSFTSDSGTFSTEAVSMVIVSAQQNSNTIGATATCPSGWNTYYGGIIGGKYANTIAICDKQIAPTASIGTQTVALVSGAIAQAFVVAAKPN